MRGVYWLLLLLLLLLFYDLEFTEALVIMFKNKYSSFIVELAKQFLFYMELLVTRGLVFTDKILRYKVTSLDIYSTVAWARVLIVSERGNIKAK